MSRKLELVREVKLFQLLPGRRESSRLEASGVALLSMGNTLPTAAKSAIQSFAHDTRPPHTLTEAAKRNGLSISALHYRLKNWPIERALRKLRCRKIGPPMSSPLFDQLIPYKARGRYFERAGTSS